MSVFTGIAQALQSTLQADPAVAEGRVWRDRLQPVQRQFDSAVVIRIDKTDGARGGVDGSPIDWSTDFAIECYARCPPDLLPSEAVDPLLQIVFARLAGPGPALGDDLDVEDLLPDPRIEWDLGEGDTPLVCAAFTVRIVHRSCSDQLVPWSWQAQRPT